jgi:hypothetical protein
MLFALAVKKGCETSARHVAVTYDAKVSGPRS